MSAPTANPAPTPPPSAAPALVEDGLCHAYAEYGGYDCLQVAPHNGNHGDANQPS